MIRSSPSNPSSSSDPSPVGNAHWSHMRETGTLLGMRFLFRLHQVFGRSVFKVILIFVSAYFVISRGEYRRASQDYLQTHYKFYPLQWSRPPRLIHTFRHFAAFGETILDKCLAWSTNITEDSFDIVNRSEIDRILNDKRGQLIIGTHLGNLEYCRGFMRNNKNKIINILIHDRHSANFAQAMENVNPDSRLNIYQVDEMDLPMILNLKSKIDDGEWLFIAGDRTPVDGYQRTVRVDFMNRPAALPIGPYQLANTLGCPVKLMFAYRHEKKITVDLISFSEKLILQRENRDELTKHYAQLFAKELEKQCKTIPYQWFNFYNFWALTDENTVIAPHNH